MAILLVARITLLEPFSIPYPYTHHPHTCHFILKASLVKLSRLRNHPGVLSYCSAFACVWHRHLLIIFVFYYFHVSADQDWVYIHISSIWTGEEYRRHGGDGWVWYRERFKKRNPSDKEDRHTSEPLGDWATVPVITSISQRMSALVSRLAARRKERMPSPSRLPDPIAVPKLQSSKQPLSSTSINSPPSVTASKQCYSAVCVRHKKVASPRPFCYSPACMASHSGEVYGRSRGLENVCICVCLCCAISVCMCVYVCMHANIYVHMACFIFFYQHQCFFLLSLISHNFLCQSQQLIQSRPGSEQIRAIAMELSYPTPAVPPPPFFSAPSVKGYLEALLFSKNEKMQRRNSNVSLQDFSSCPFSLFLCI